MGIEAGAAWVDLHGLRVAIRVEGFADPYAQGILPRFLERRPACREGDGPADLIVELSGRSVDRGAIRRVEALPAAFFHGRTRAFSADDGVVLSDGWSTVHVERDRALVRADVDPRSLADGYAFGQTTLFIAVVLALRAHGRFHLHAGGAVLPSGRGVLVAGEGGSGKTSTIMALLSAGAEYVSDDSVLLMRDGGAVAALGLPSLFHLGDATLRAHDELEAVAGRAYALNHDKREMDPRQAFPGREVERIDAPALLVFPSIGSEPATRAEPCPQADAMGALTRASALVVVDGIGDVPAHLGLLRDVASGAAAFELRLGADALADPLAIVRALEEVAGAAL